MKTLLLQLASTISALKTSFAQMKASARAGEPIKKSESAMEEELRRLSNLQIGMYELIQEYDLGSQGGPHAPQTCDSNMNNMPSDAEKQGMILKSYEGIIKRFHDEIRKKDAVTDALKETLAKTVLKSEKLEKRVKSLEAKLAAMELK
ncbi:hypothetical protein KP509_22G035400 [Ceratopteris richardii]|nr:hypothetical protein KP509_22G035400 [Ceratopteris richardii]